MRNQVADYLQTGEESEGTAIYSLMGTGFNSLDESPSAQVDSKIYINEKSSTKEITGYETVFAFDTDLIADEDAVEFIYDIGRNQKIGTEAQTSYVRVELFRPIEESTTKFAARKFTVAVEVSDISGEGGTVIGMTGNLNSVGDFVDGTFDTSTKTFTALSAEPTTPGGV